MERSSEDRERARAEREARRAARQTAVDEPPAPAEPPPAPAEPPIEAEPYDAFEPVAPAAPPPESPRRVRTSRRPPRPPRRAPRAAGGRHWGRRVFALLALAAIVFALYVINATFQPFHGDGTGAVRVTIPKGTDADEIGDVLAAKGVVDSGRFFSLNATVTGRRGGLRPGNYTLRRGMTNGQAIEALTKGPKAKVVKTTNITIPEGPSIKEEAPKIDKTSLTGSYAKAASSPQVLAAIRKLGAPKSAKNAEGYMFPATYTVVEGAPVKDLVNKQLGAYKQNFAKVDMGYARRKKLTRYDVLIIASLVEREAQLDKERPLIASVIYNRLKAGTPLGIDATLRYELNMWNRPLRVSELERDTPYNTRTRRDLPPTPIGNPGLKSLRAAAHPARTDYFFFVRKPGDSGAHAFSETDAEFQRDVARYQASRGGP
jgi:peptidoglycan lytic transglycosylase G